MTTPGDATERYLRTLEDMSPDPELQRRIDALREGLALPPHPYQPGAASEASIKAMEATGRSRPRD